jgi:ABC-2 type transport system permease protein
VSAELEQPTGTAWPGTGPGGEPGIGPGRGPGVEPGGDGRARMNAWSAIRVVSTREISVKLRDKAFIWSTIFMLLLVTAATVIPVLISQQVPSLRVAIRGSAAEQVIGLAAELGAEAREDDPANSPIALLDVGGLPAADITWVTTEPGVDVSRLLRDEDVAAALIGDEFEDLRLVGLESVPEELETLVTAASSELQVARTAEESGLAPEEVIALTQPTPPSIQLLDVRPEGTMPPQMLILVFAFLFYLSVLTFGMSIAQSVVEEKQSRVVELLVAAIPVRWLLAGKVIGNTIMAVGQVVVIVGAGLLGAVVAGQGELIRQILGASWWFVLFFLLGFVMLACLWAVGGSLASRIEDLSSTTAVMQVLVIVPFFAAIFLIDPSPMQRLLSYVPFTAPLLMPARVVNGTAEAWEPWVAALGVLVTAVLFVALGARLYAGSVLHTSGRLKATQAWRGSAD